MIFYCKDAKFFRKGRKGISTQMTQMRHFDFAQCKIFADNKTDFYLCVPLCLLCGSLCDFFVSQSCTELMVGNPMFSILFWEHPVVGKFHYKRYRLFPRALEPVRHYLFED